MTPSEQTAWIRDVGEPPVVRVEQNLFGERRLFLIGLWPRKALFDVRVFDDADPSIIQRHDDASGDHIVIDLQNAYADYRIVGVRFFDGALLAELSYSSVDVNEVAA